MTINKARQLGERRVMKLKTSGVTQSAILCDGDGFDLVQLTRKGGQVVLKLDRRIVTKEFTCGDWRQFVEAVDNLMSTMV